MLSIRRTLFLFATLIISALSYSDGFTSCSNYVPGHGTIGPSNTFSVILTGSAVSTTPITSYVAGTTYGVYLSGGQFKGFYIGSDLVPVTPGTSQLAACGGTRVTHNSASTKTTTTGVLTAPDSGSGPLTITAVVVVQRVTYYVVSVMIPELGDASESATVSPSITMAGTGTPSALATVSVTPSFGSSLSQTPSLSSTPSYSPTKTITRTSTPTPTPTALSIISYAFSTAISPVLTLAWTLNASHIMAHVSCTSPGAWASITMNPNSNTMKGGDAVLIEPGAGSVTQAYLNSNSAGGVIRLSDSEMTLREVKFDSTTTTTAAAAAGGRQLASTSNTWIASWTRSLSSGTYPNAQSIPSAGAATMVVAWGNAGEGFAIFHGSRVASYSINFATGEVTSIATNLVALYTAHGVLMFLAWAVIFPVGALASRSRSRLGAPKSSFWFLFHRRMMISGWILLVIALIIIIFAKGMSDSPHFSTAHGTLGLIVAIIGLLQPLNAYFRPHVPDATKGEKISTARIVWESAHKGLGWGAIVIGAPASIFLGLIARSAAPAFTYVYATIFALTIIAIGIAIIDSEYFKRRSMSKVVTIGPSIPPTSATIELTSAAGIGGGGAQKTGKQPAGSWRQGNAGRGGYPHV